MKNYRISRPCPICKKQTKDIKEYLQHITKHKKQFCKAQDLDYKKKKYYISWEAVKRFAIAKPEFFKDGKENAK